MIHFAWPEGNLYFAFKGSISADRQRDMALRRTALRNGTLSSIGRFKARAVDSIGNKMLSKWMKDFIDHCLIPHKGQQVFIFGPEPLLAKLALTFVPEGYTDMFAPSSIVSIGGGLKGAKLPPNYRNIISQFCGIKKESIIDGYGMTEKNPLPIPHKGRWIIPPWEIPILLDEDSGELIEMDSNGGKYTGQYAFFDPTALSYWGGIITGDRVTINWDGFPESEYVGPTIEIVGRISDLDGPDADKLSCSASFEDYFNDEEF
ncbi:MAG: hypothetical protein ACFFD1_05505 [Candidatus Thorarchaeota archaeon]